MNKKTKNSPIVVNFGKRLRELRKNIGLSQAEISDKISRRNINRSRNLVGSWERAERYANIEDLVYLCEILKTDPNAILGWESMQMNYIVSDIHSGYDPSVSLKDSDFLQLMNSFSMEEKHILYNLLLFCRENPELWPVLDEIVDSFRFEEDSQKKEF